MRNLRNKLKVFVCVSGCSNGRRRTLYVKSSKVGRSLIALCQGDSDIMHGVHRLGHATSWVSCANQFLVLCYRPPSRLCPCPYTGGSTFVDF